MSHADMINKLMPVKLGELSDEEISVEGQMFDSFYSNFSSVLNEMFPSTATDTLTRWEKEYGIKNQSVSITNRRATVNARLIERVDLKNGGLRKSKFISIAEALGYTIQISSSSDFFRADISAADDILYDTDVLWTMIVTVAGVSSAPDLEQLFTDIRPPYLRLVFIYQ